MLDLISNEIANDAKLFNLKIVMRPAADLGENILELNKKAHELFNKYVADVAEHTDSNILGEVVTGKPVDMMHANRTNIIIFYFIASSEKEFDDWLNYYDSKVRKSKYFLKAFSLIVLLNFKTFPMEVFENYKDLIFFQAELPGEEFGNFIRGEIKVIDPYPERARGILKWATQIGIELSDTRLQQTLFNDISEIGAPSDQSNDDWELYNEMFMKGSDSRPASRKQSNALELKAFTSKNALIIFDIGLEFSYDILQKIVEIRCKAVDSMLITSATLDSTKFNDKKYSIYVLVINMLSSPHVSKFKDACKVKDRIIVIEVTHEKLKKESYELESKNGSILRPIKFNYRKDIKYSLGKPLPSFSFPNYKNESNKLIKKIDEILNQ